MYYADLKRGEEQAEADRLLGQLVRKMPKDHSLTHYGRMWAVEKNTSEGTLLGDWQHTPEQALKAALEGEGVER